MKNQYNPEKTITFILDHISQQNDTDAKVCYTYLETFSAIKHREPNIVTYSLANISFDLLDYGYKIILKNKDKSIELYPGMKSVGQKEIRYGHNMLRVIMAGYFDDDIDINRNEL